VVLVVDDEQEVRTSIQKYLSRCGYRTLTAEDGEEALARLDENRVAVMVSDINMPRLNGAELLPKAIAKDPDLAVIMLTAVGEPQSAIQCLKLGAADYLTKPVELEELGLSLQHALRKRELEIERRALEAWLAREVALKTRELEEQTRGVGSLALSVLTALVNALEPKDRLSRNHSARVADLAARVAARMELSDQEVEEVRLAAGLHDLGALAVREEALRESAGSATPEIAGPPDAAALAAGILTPLRQHSALIEIIRCQFERVDGRGAPEGRRGDEIPIGARILAAANVYDELTASGEGHQGMAPEEALRSMRGLAGTMLDPAVLAALEPVVGGA
jgi:response regulator RpfG family c-di-GMP phosphodiesterase